MYKIKRYIKIGTKAIVPFLAALAMCLALSDDAGAAKATVGGTTGGAGRAGHPAAGKQSELEILKRRYYLAEEGERIQVLDQIRKLGTPAALAFNVDLLRYPDMKVRREAVDILKRWGQPGYMAVFKGMDDPEINWLCESIFVELGQRGTPFLVDLLEDPDPSCRGRAAYLLGSTRDPYAIGPLYKQLKDPDRDVRIQVIQSLCDLGDERSLEGILELLETEDVGLSDFVMQAAEKFGPRSAGPLRAALKAESPRIRSGAAMALGRLRLPETLPDLFEALGDRDTQVRRSVVKALDGYHHMLAAEGLLAALKDPDLEVQDYATTALARLHPEIYPVLMEKVRDPAAGVRKNAITAFRKIGDRKAVPTIISALDDPDANVRMFAVTALIEFRDPRAIRALIARMKTEDQLGWLISYAFMEIGSESVDELLKATGDDSFCMTRNLVIFQMGDKAVDTLHQRAREMGDTATRFNAIAILGELKRPESVPVLAGLLSSGEVSWVAANALASMGEPAFDSLVKIARQGNMAGEAALSAIAKLEDPVLYPELADLLGDPDDGLREVAVEPLIRAGGPAVPLVVEKMAMLEGVMFSGAAEILCRVKDQKAIKPLSKVLFPEPWEPSLLDSGRLFDLRQAYMKKGSLAPVLDRLRSEAGSAAGGGGPWERVAP
ncbi:MAG: HEAT repeat domain-containing protein [bacterium]|nr:HEAT repeat domain-containing protein [bacterium]